MTEIFFDDAVKGIPKPSTALYDSIWQMPASRVLEETSACAHAIAFQLASAGQIPPSCCPRKALYSSETIIDAPSDFVALLLEDKNLRRILASIDIRVYREASQASIASAYSLLQILARKKVRLFHLLQDQPSRFQLADP